MPAPSIQFQSVDILKRYLLAVILALGLFASLLLSVVNVPGLAQWDASLAAVVQGLRSDGTDRLMVVLTMLGDLSLALWMVATVIAGLLCLRRWWLALHLLCVGLSAMLSVSLIKSILARARPDVPSITLDSFSFPSGHACTAAVTWGLVALILAYGRRPRQRCLIHAAGFVMASAVAISRVYLHVHWPSDVIAGMALGYGLLTAFAWQLHTAPVLRLPTFARLLAFCSAITAIHVLGNYPGQATLYSIASRHASIELHADR
ncbi:phosphatase PAP2 family protein [Granulosicoccus sp. 3-233]|uniref:phosphatase PAP2 family protein n=1 Tax=Granulosicoccus sp. 3-233 TaxID=3417969 RepID=UPI003D337FDD